MIFYVTKNKRFLLFVIFRESILYDSCLKNNLSSKVFNSQRGRKKIDVPVLQNWKMENQYKVGGVRRAKGHKSFSTNSFTKQYLWLQNMIDLPKLFV